MAIRIRSQAQDPGLIVWDASPSVDVPLTQLESRTRKIALAPIELFDVELTRPLYGLTAGFSDVNGRPYERGRILVRLGGEPLGLVDVELVSRALSPTALAAAIWDTTGTAIRQRHTAVGREPPRSLTPFGLVSPTAEVEIDARDLPSVTVVIATRERPERLECCLESLRAVDYPRFDVIVVDNAPDSDRTSQVVERYAHQLRVQRIVEPIKGGSIARNIGIAAARGDVIAVTDDDVRVEPSWLRRLVMPLVQDPQCDCVTGLVLPAELETHAQVWFEQFGSFTKGFLRRTFDLGEHRPAGALYPYSPGMFGSGNNVAYRREALVRLGGFDERLGPGTPTHGGEDLDLFLRIVLDGRRLTYEPAAVVHHFHRREYRSLVSQVHGYGIGLSAFLTKSIITHPSRSGGILSRAPEGMRVLLNADSPKNSNKHLTYPKHLTHQELRGFLMGPVAFARSSLRVRALHRSRARLRTSWQEGEPAP